MWDVKLSSGGSEPVGKEELIKVLLGLKEIVDPKFFFTFYKGYSIIYAVLADEPCWSACFHAHKLNVER